MQAPLGRRPKIADKLDHQLVIPITSKDHDRLKREADQAGYRSLAAFLRDKRLSA